MIVTVVQERLGVPWSRTGSPPVSGGDATTTSLHAGDVVADVLGLPNCGLRRRPPIVVEQQWHVEVAVRDTPWGGYGVGVTVDGRGIVRAGATGETDMRIEAPFAEVVLWLHGLWPLGHLLRRDRSVTGDLFVWSAVSGVVSAPSADPATLAIRAVLVGYACAQLA